MTKQYRVGEDILVKGIVNSEVSNGGIHVLHDGIDAFYTLDQIYEPEKPVVPQVAVDYYEAYKNVFISFEEWFSDSYISDFATDFEGGDKLVEWLYDNDKKTNRKHELAFATLIVNGLDAVQIEQPQLYTVEIPNPNEIGGNKHVLAKDKNGVVRITFISFINWKEMKDFQLTEKEIKKDFEWAWQFAKPVEVE